MFHHLADVIRLDCVEHVEEVATFWELTLWKAVGHEALYLRVIFDLRVEVFDRALIIFWNHCKPYPFHLKQVLFICEDLAQKILRKHPARRQVPLKTKHAQLKTLKRLTTQRSTSENPPFH